MSTQKRNVLKNCFRKGLIPTQAQFEDVFDSYFHKSEDMIPVGQVEGLITKLESNKNELQEYLDSQLQDAIKDEVDLLSKQRISYVSPCFADCASTHEAKLRSITLASSNVPFKSIFSVTLKIADTLTLLDQRPVYMHLHDLLDNHIGVSQNAVRQMDNKGKYVTWFFDSAINTTVAPIVIKLHTSNSASGASDSNLVGIIAHVNKTEGIKGSGVTSDDGTYHTDWTPAIGINVFDISAIYPKMQEMSKYRMAYATSELPDISSTGHKANIKEIRINQNTMGISLVNSVSVMVASDSAHSGELYLKVHDINDNLVAMSNNSVRLSQNLGKYVTWYFTPFQLTSDATYRFTVWDNSDNKHIMRLHVANGKNEGITCYDQNDSPHTDYCPAFGVNISAIFADDLNKYIKEVNLALGKEILTNSSSINSLGEAMEGVLYDIGQIKDNIEIAGSTVIELEASALGITSDTALTEGTLIDVYSGESGGGMLSTEITLNTGQTIISSANNIRALTVFAGNVIGRIKHRVLQVGGINYTANEPMSVYVCYRPQGAISTEVKVRDRTQLEEQITQKADITYVDTQLATKVDKVAGKGLSSNDYTTPHTTTVETFSNFLSNLQRVQLNVQGIVSSEGLGQLYDWLPYFNVGAQIPLANHYTITAFPPDGPARIPFVEYSCQTRYEVVYQDGKQQPMLYLRVPYRNSTSKELKCKMTRNSSNEDVWEVLEVKDVKEVPSFCLGTLWEDESLIKVDALIPIANHYTFRHKISGSDNEYVELNCDTYIVDNYTGSANLKELFIKVPYDEHTYCQLRCLLSNDGHNYTWIVKEKILEGDDVYDTVKIPYIFSPLKYTDDKVSPKADKAYVDEQLATKANIGYVNAHAEILTTALETKANKTDVDTQLASRSGLLHIGEVSSEDDFFSRIATHAVVTNPTAQIVTATYTSGSGTGTLVALQQVRANTSGDGGGTTMQYIYCNKTRYTRYIDFTATAVTSVQSMQPEGVRNLQYANGILSLTGMWGATIGSTVNLTSVDKTAIREGTSTTDQVQLTVTKPFGNTASAYISAATSAKAGIMTAEMYDRLNNLIEQIGRLDGLEARIEALEVQ